MYIGVCACVRTPVWFVCVSVCVCVCVCACACTCEQGQDLSGPFKINFAAPSNLAYYQAYTSNEAQDFPYGGVMVVSLFQKLMAQVTKP
jgi:hypothetical protein